MASLAPGVTLFLPELVEIECEQEWIRRFEDRKRKVERAVNDLATHTDGFVRPEFVFPTRDEALRKYQELVHDTKHATGLATSPLTGRTAFDLLSMSAAHTSPFPAKDGGFRDATIALSIAEHIQASGIRLEAILLTADNFFHTQRLDNDSVLRVTGDLDAVYDELEKMIVSAKLTAWHADSARAKQTLETDFAAITRFLQENLEIPVHTIGLKVREIRDLTIKEITSVITPKPFERGADVRGQISFTAIVTFHEIMETLGADPAEPFRPPRVRVGEPVPEQPLGMLQIANFGRVGARDIVAVDVDEKVSVEAEAHIIDNQYVAFSYQSAELVNAMNPGMRALLDRP